MTPQCAGSGCALAARPSRPTFSWHFRQICLAGNSQMLCTWPLVRSETQTIVALSTSCGAPGAPQRRRLARYVKRSARTGTAASEATDAPSISSKQREGKKRAFDEREDGAMDAAEEAIKDMAERVAESALEGRSLGSASFFNLMLSSAKKGAAMTPVTDVAQREPVLLCPGAGIFFFWQVGAVRYMLDHYEDVPDMRMVGASAGALISVLTACGVAPEQCLLEAYRLSLQADLWERPLGLLGIWGGLVRDWLMKLLPDDAAERCEGRVALVVTRLPGLEIEAFSHFADKRDLVEATMASVHVPFFLDLRGWANFRGSPCVDGSLIEFLSNGAVASYAPFVESSHAGVDLDYFLDEELQWTRADFLKLRSWEDILSLYAKGYEFAKRIDAQGRAPAFQFMRKRKVPLSTKPDLASLSKEGEEVAAEVALERAAEKMSTSMDWEDSRTSSWWW